MAHIQDDRTQIAYKIMYEYVQLVIINLHKSCIFVQLAIRYKSQQIAEGCGISLNNDGPYSNSGLNV